MQHKSRGGLRRHLTYANVISTLALFLVVAGGSALAASKLSKNSVTSKTVKNGSLTSADLKDGKGVRGSDVVDGSLTGADVGDSSLSGADVADGSLKGADIADGSINTPDLADNAVNSTKVADNSLKGNDVADNSLTGTDINESTLGEVPNAAKLEGKTGQAFVSSRIYKKESPAITEGTDLGDGTFTQSLACNSGDVLLNGGPADLSPSTVMVESFPTPNSTNSWSARVKPAAADNYIIVLLCAEQVQLPEP
jgi:hypothetical protein